jgi:transposase-like protein
VSSETLRKWIRQAQADDGRRPGTSSRKSAELKRLRRENVSAVHQANYSVYGVGKMHDTLRRASRSAATTSPG